jgi:hypothetical protein
VTSGRPVVIVLWLSELTAELRSVPPVELGVAVNSSVNDMVIYHAMNSCYESPFRTNNILIIRTKLARWQSSQGLWHVTWIAISGLKSSERDGAHPYNCRTPPRGSLRPSLVGNIAHQSYATRLFDLHEWLDRPGKVPHECHKTSAV